MAVRVITKRTTNDEEHKQFKREISAFTRQVQLTRLPGISAYTEDGVAYSEARIVYEDPDKR